MIRDIMNRPIEILLVEDNPGDVRLLRELLRLETSSPFTLAHVDRLEEAAMRLVERQYDVLLLDLSLPDGQGLDTFVRMREIARDVPIIVLTGNDDTTLALQAVKSGAQDYLVKGEVDERLLPRAIRYAIERHRLQQAICNLCLIDDLTGLYNRRGLLAFAEQHRKVAARSCRGFLLVFADLDGLKQINDSYGHLEGDAALIGMARVLQSTFRESDVLARVSGDEFAVIALDCDADDAAAIEERLEEQVAMHHEASTHRYRLSFSIGATYYDPADPCSMEDLLTRADVLMYKRKRERRVGTET